jgi:hypothetical protein
MKSIRYSLSILAVLFFTVDTVFSQTVTPEELHKIGTAPSADNIKEDIQTLVNFGTRHTLSDTLSETRGIGAARRWIKGEFDRISSNSESSESESGFTTRVGISLLLALSIAPISGLFEISPVMQAGISPR